MVKISFLICHFTAMTCQIFFPCYYGSMVYEKSFEIRVDAFASNWVEQSSSVKKSLTIFIEGTMRPIEMLAGSLFPLNLSTFLAVSIFLNYLNNCLLLLLKLTYFFNYRLDDLPTRCSLCSKT